jgi:RNA polymerase sigma-70 factor (ECF subfamily)
MSIDQAIEQYGALVIHLAWRITRDEEETRDICQEVFLRLHTAWTAGQQIDQLKAWLSRTAIRAAMNSRRRKARQIPLTEALLPLTAPGGLADLDRALLIDKIRQLAQLLPERQQEVFVLRHFEGLPFEEIGRIVGCSPLAARSAAFQALQKMRAWLTGESTPDEPAPEPSGRDANAAQE